MLEAMVLGALPVQSDTVSTREWISDGENGLLVPPEDAGAVERALRRAVSDDDLVERAARINEQLTAERVDFRRIAPRVVELYRRVAEE
jgi:glycosyltransferase involved in cell wall biosynthesis